MRKGGWMPPPGAVFSVFDQALQHVVPDDREDPNRPVHPGLDVGTHSAAVLGHDCPAKMCGITGEVARGLGPLVVDKVVGVGCQSRTSSPP